ncbi:50S ribosomal protein L1, mitochondrial, putative [Plasmodium chabaudi chabaudi]|uniref:50S ribosomal protein L1, mitochondrial, putative n=1 Tax=Plasmodium chabaudi chabaudi TaxID=31271 RepID=A0A4V0KAG2_PLACU|nr:50S ribosomal protein L1, mitochondrial, putative [Plasmodium chabaudi chabaudi]VTZ69693.1 50S ribosomal protein L1, mitochondrial, putative [Plasmodium chabaudi chabaudi]|eukprot:XP_745300.1 50S ribosomal protein L1, mitochondrial, putative [Plasmodium chabaudi chabaudi]
MRRNAFFCKNLFSYTQINVTRKCAKDIFFVEKRGRKYIPFYDEKKEKKKNINTGENVNNENKNEEEGKNKQKENYSIFWQNLMPPISPMKGLKLLLSFDTQLGQIDVNKEKPIDFNLIIKIDIKRESLRGMCNLTHSVDKKKKILVLIEEDNENLKKYGANYVGLDYINKIKNGWLDFDICITNFKNINKILPIAKILGPKKLMPNVKSNTLVDNLKETIIKIKSGNSIEYRSEQIDTNTFELYKNIYNFNKIDKNSLAHINVKIASTDMPFLHILDNIKSFVSEIVKNNIHSSHTDKENKSTFVWPPITKKINKPNKYYTQTSNILTNNSEDSSDSFILGGYLTLPGLPKFFLKPNLLYTHSDGYVN